MVRGLPHDPAGEGVLDQRLHRLLVAGDQLVQVPAGRGVVGADAEVVLVEAGPRLVAPLQPQVGAEDGDPHRDAVEEQLEQLRVEAGRLVGATAR